MNKLFTSLAAFLLISLMGCVTPTNQPTVPVDKTASYVTDLRDLAEIGTVAALAENPNCREGIERTVSALRQLEALPDTITLDTLTVALRQLPAMKSAKAQLYIAGGRIILRRAGRDVELGNVSGFKPITTALREGMEAGLGPP